MFVVVWGYRVRPERITDFARAYGPDGEWAQLFRRAKGFFATELLHQRGDPTRFLTIDRWATDADYETFRNQFRAEYAAIDARMESLTTFEHEMGTFDAPDISHAAI